MSVRIYRLLRNNKEEGPLTAEELISKQLRTYDLIWIDGRSASWNYPGELPEFKKYAPLPDQENNRQPLTAVSASIQAAVAMNNNIVSVAPQKPRYKVSAAWTKIQTTPSPALNNESTRKIKEPMVKASELNQGTLNESKSLSWEEAWLDWEKEKDFDEPDVKPVTGKKTNASQAKKIVTTSAPQLEVKYAQSLDTLKEKYIDNIVQQKLNSKRSSGQNNLAEFVIPAAALIIIFSVGYWLLNNTSTGNKTVPAALTHQSQPVAHSNNNTPDNSTQTPGSNTQTSEVASNATPQQDNDLSENSFIDNDKATDRKQDLPNTKPVQRDEAVKQQNSVSQLPSVPDSEQSTDKSANKIPAVNAVNNSTAVNPLAKIADTTNTVAVNNSNANTSSANTNIFSSVKKTKSTGDYVSVPSYITMDNGTGAINVQNVSDINLDLVVINVQYFTASGTFHKGETLYLHNLRAGRNVIIRTPKDDTSSYAISNVSLVSADAEKVYIVGDN